ncbi:MAG: hypothetical protein MN733_33370 [Nitrososphaera sp.]|nr:hypothetical protein [Nitrososphaera sp.]
MVTMKLIATICYMLDGVPLCQDELIAQTRFDNLPVEQVYCGSAAEIVIALFLKTSPEYKGKEVEVMTWKCGTDISPRGRA